MAHELKSLSHRHRSIITWLLLNPHRPLKDCAAELGYTPQSIYNIVGSDLFQAEFQQAMKEVDRPMVIDLRSKLLGLTHALVDSTHDDLRNGTLGDRSKVEMTKIMLQALGYIDSPATPQQHLHIHADAESLMRARELAKRLAQPKNEIIDAGDNR